MLSAWTKTAALLSMRPIVESSEAHCRNRVNSSFGPTKPAVSPKEP
jgi:hypothetical protein